MVQYKYDAWGKPISKTGSMASTLGTVQPFQYRGYVYDEETGLYYLKSRYYFSECSRFINGDSLFLLNTSMYLSQNLYTYCENDPVVGYDPEGYADPDLIDDDTSDLLEDMWRESKGGKQRKLSKSRSTSKGKITNTFGKKGSPPHQKKIVDAAKQLSQSGVNMTEGEQFVATPNGLKATHWGDRGIFSSQGELRGVLQVGLLNGNGTPVAREMRAIYDFHTEGLFVVFVPYSPVEDLPTIYMIFMP